jgi:hypothetical protein
LPPFSPCEKDERTEQKHGCHEQQHRRQSRERGHRAGDRLHQRRAEEEGEIDRRERLACHLRIDELPRHAEQQRLCRGRQANEHEQYEVVLRRHHGKAEQHRDGIVRRP